MSSGLWSFARKAEPSRTPRQARGDQSDDNSPRPGDPGFLEKALPTLRLPVDSVFGDGWSGAALCEHEDGRTALEHFMAKLSEESASPLEIDDDQDRSPYHQQRPRKESASPYQAHDRYGRSSDLPCQLEDEASPSAASFSQRHLSPSPEYIAAVGGSASHGSYTTAGRSPLSVSPSPRQFQDPTAPNLSASPAVPLSFGAAAGFGDVAPVGSPEELRQTQKPRAGIESRTDTPSAASAPSASANVHVHVPVASFTAIDPMALLQATDPSPSAEAPGRRPSSSSRRALPTMSPSRTNAAGSRPSSGNRSTSRTPRAGGLATQSLQRPSAAFAKSTTPRTTSAPSNGSRLSSSVVGGPPAASPRVGGRTPPPSSARSTARRSSEPAPSTNAGGECEGAASPVRPPTARERAKQRAMSTPPPSSRKTQSAAFAKPAEKRTGPNQPATDTAGAPAPSSAKRPVRKAVSPGSASSHWRSARASSSGQQSRATMSNAEASSLANDRRGQMWADAALGEQRIPTTLQDELLLLDAAAGDTHQVARTRGDDPRALDIISASERLSHDISQRAKARPSESGVKRTVSPHADVAVDFDAAALDAEADDIIAQVQRRFQTSPSFKQFAAAKAKDLDDVIAVCKTDDLALASPLTSKSKEPVAGRSSNVAAGERSRPTTARELFSDSARSPAAKTSVSGSRSPAGPAARTAATSTTSPVGPKTTSDDSSPECAAERQFKGQLQDALSDDVAAALEDLRIGGASDVVDRHGRARVSGVMTAGLPESAASLRLERMAQRHRTTQDDHPSSVGGPGVSPAVSTGFEQAGEDGVAPADHSRHGGEGPVVGDGEDAAFAAMMARLDEEVEESTVALMQVAADHFREEEQAARAKSRELQAMGLPPRQGQKLKTAGGDRSVAVIGAAKKTVAERRKSTLDRSAASFAKTSKTSSDPSSSAQRRSSNTSTSNGGSTSANAGTTAKVRAAVIAGALQPSRERPTALSYQRSEAVKAAAVKKAEPELSEATLAVVRHIQREAAARAKARKAQEAAAAQEAATEEVAPVAAEHAANDAGIVGTGSEVSADYEEAATTPAPVPAATHRPRASPADLGDDDDLFAPLPLSARPFRQAAIEQHQCAQRQAVPDDNVVNESSVPDVVDDRPDSNRKPGSAVVDPADDGMVKESSIPDVSESGKRGNVEANSPTAQEPQLSGEQKPKKYRRKRFVVDPTLPPPPPPPGTPPPTPPKAQVAASPRCGGPSSAHGDESTMRDQRIPVDCSPETNRPVPRSELPRRSAEKVMATTAILSARCSREAWRESPLDGLPVVPSPMSSEASMEHREVRSSLTKSVRASLSLGPRQGSPLHHVNGPVPQVQSQIMSEDAPTPSVPTAAIFQCDEDEDENKDEDEEEDEAVVPCAELIDTARSESLMIDATSSAAMTASKAPPAIPTFTESPQQLRCGSTSRSTRCSGAELTGASAITVSSVQGSAPSVMASGCRARVRYDVTSSSIASGLVSTSDGGSVNASSASRNVGRPGVGGVPRGTIPLIDMRPVQGDGDGAEDHVFHGQQFHGHDSTQRPFDGGMYDDDVGDDDYHHGNPIDLDHGEYLLHDEYSRHVGYHDHRYGAAPCPATLDDAVVGIDEECVLSSGDVSLTLSGIEVVATPSHHERELRVSDEGHPKPVLDRSPRLVSPRTDSSANSKQRANPEPTMARNSVDSVAVATPLRHHPRPAGDPNEGHVNTASDQNPRLVSPGTAHSKQAPKPELPVVRVSVKAASEWLESLRAVIRVRYTNVDDAVRTDCTADDHVGQRSNASGVVGAATLPNDVARPALPRAPVSAATPPPPPPAAEAVVPLRAEEKQTGKTCAADRMAERHAARVAARDAMSKRKFEQQQAALAAKIKETAEAEQHVIDQRKRLDAQRQRRLNKERLVKLNEAREQQRIDALMMVAVSADHIRVLKHCGFLPWRRAVLAARSDRQEILQHGTKRRVFSAWKEEAAKSKRHRFAVTVARGVSLCRFVRHAVLNAAFVQWRRLVAQHRKDTAYAKRHRMRTLLRRMQSKSAVKRRGRQDEQSSIAAVTERRWAMRSAWNTWSRRKKSAVEARQRTEVRSKLWAVAQGVLGDL